MKRVLSGLLALCITTSFTMQSDISLFNTIFAEDTETDSAEDTIMEIDTKYLKAGEEIRVKNAENLSLKWYVDDTFVSVGKYTPAEQDYEKWIRVDAYDGEILTASSSVYFSKLPVLYINTDDGNDITQKDIYKTADMTIQNNKECDDVIYSDDIEIKGRGNSTWSLPKKPYKIKLDKKTDLFGMGKNKHWVLLANYVDNCFLRNSTAFQVSKELGLETMDSRWVDVVLNGSYTGNYLLCEHIRVGDERVDIFDWEDEAEAVASAVYKAEKDHLTKEDKSNIEDLLKTDLSWITKGIFRYNKRIYQISRYYDIDSDISGGYLFELSLECDEISNFSTKNGLKIMVNSPEYLNTNSDMMKYATSYWQRFEDAYMSEDGYADAKEKTVHYTDLADLDSMVSYWLTMEIMGNSDSGLRSRYAYKDKGSKMVFGPAWDFDLIAFSGSAGYSVGWKISQALKSQSFYNDWLDDPLFLAKATEKYWSIRDYLGTLVADNGILDSEYAYLYESGTANELRWHNSETNNNIYTKDFEKFKAYLKNRLTWLDEQFSTDAALLKSTYTSKSTYPYIKSDDMIKIFVNNSKADTVSEHAPADFITGKYTDPDISISVSDQKTSVLNIYVNGLFYRAVEVKDGKADFSIDNKYLTEDINKKNVISVIGKNADNNTTYKNFTTVIKTDDQIDNSIKYSSLSLSGNIGLNLYADFPEEMLTDKSAYVKISVDGNEVKNVYVSKLQQKEYNGKSYSVINADVNSNQLDKEITVQVCAGYKTSEPVTYKINDLISVYSKDESLNRLVSSLSAYGSYSSKYFNKSESEVSDDMKALVSEVEASTLSNFEKNISGETPSGISYYGSSLVLKSKTSIRHYFTLEEGKNIADYNFKLKTKSEEKELVPVQKDRLYYVEISNIAAADLGKDYKVICDDYTISYSAMSYVYSVLKKEKADTNLQDLLKSLYLYYKEADKYKETQN